jgi:predicted nuclease of predicted toxin-antitoxin system
VKIKIDENLASSHRALLEQDGHDLSDVHDEKLRGASDEKLWAAVCEEERFLITLDHDFSDVRRYPPGSHPGILLLRTQRPGRDGVARILKRVLDEQELDALKGCLSVADERRTRIRRVP